MRLTGQLLMIEDKPYDFTDDTGSKVSGTSTTMHVLDGIVVTKCKVRQDDVAKIAHFEPGDQLDLRVSVTANAGARGAWLSVTFVSEWAAAPALAAVQNF